MRNAPVLREAVCRNCAADFTWMAAGGKAYLIQRGVDG